MDKSSELIEVSIGTIELLTLLRERGPMTRSEIGTATGWARPTVNRRIDELAAIGIAQPLAIPSATGGRPAQGFSFNASCAYILSIDIATTATAIALCDLSGQPISTQTINVGAENEPEDALRAISSIADAILTAGLDDTGSTHTPRLYAISVAVTTRVETVTGNIIQAPVMQHWENHHLREYFAGRYHVSAFIENDANVRALCKAHDLATDRAHIVPNLLYVHAGMGLGAGIISSGTIMHGTCGAAGDIGHIHVFGSIGERNLCRCGNTGCVEATAGGWAILQTLQAQGKPAHTLDDVVELANHGDIETIQLIRQAGRLIGDVVSACVNMLNPSCIVVGGELSHCGELLMNGIRERVWARAQPLATKSLRIETCSDEAQAGIIGLAYVAIDQGLTSLDMLQNFADQQNQ
ncbi:ROK family transcriptional regulator [Bifidobacterium cebidarum]|uniref:Transcriptional regulator/sugar kinase n=1 Tax=Bifidobacterium cebidarum TaxID=2650773 RepID=A0A6I1GNQ9_9BIFI|nr:ROK family transcriptional regulator [Bifidobacterium cebidarum]KAB7788191.1 transcriptional regulator/sugar kinase [Bifidobacterium cebidarum]